MRIYKYKIKYMNDCTDASEFSIGFVLGENYSDALGKISYSYGENQLLEVLNLSLIGEGEVIEMATSVIDENSNPMKRAEEIIDTFANDFIW